MSVLAIGKFSESKWRIVTCAWCVKYGSWHRECELGRIVFGIEWALGIHISRSFQRRHMPQARCISQRSEIVLWFRCMFLMIWMLVSPRVQEGSLSSAPNRALYHGLHEKRRPVCSLSPTQGIVHSGWGRRSDLLWSIRSGCPSRVGRWLWRMLRESATIGVERCRERLLPDVLEC